jgi:hypothetical protein
LVLFAFAAWIMSCFSMACVSAAVIMFAYNAFFMAMANCFLTYLYFLSAVCDFISTRLQRWLYNIQPEEEDVWQLSAAQLRQNAADNSAALAARAAANAGRPRLTPEERAAALARSRAAAAAHEARLRESEAGTSTVHMHVSNDCCRTTVTGQSCTTAVLTFVHFIIKSMVHLDLPPHILLSRR